MKGRYKKQMDTYVALDLEMTGLKPKEDKIIEIGAVLVETGEIRDTFSTLINPGRALASEITEPCRTGYCVDRFRNQAVG